MQPTVIQLKLINQVIHSNESYAKVITSYDVTVVSHETINQSKYNNDSRVRSHVRTMSRVTS